MNLPLHKGMVLETLLPLEQYDFLSELTEIGYMEFPEGELHHMVSRGWTHL